MQAVQLNLQDLVGQDGKIGPQALPVLQKVVNQYPAFHAARVLLLRLLYQQRDPAYNEELRKAALYLPSRAKIYQDIEGDAMRPKPQQQEAFTGATHERKSKTPIEHKVTHGTVDRTDELLGQYLQTTPSMLWDRRSGRPVDATTDYIGYLLQEEANKAEEGTGVERTEEATMPDSISAFISNQGNKPIRLSEKPDVDLKKPDVEDQENTSQQGFFSEALARIYIKQGKFEQAIKIIRQLSLKYPKKNRYFADQIRFLEKLVINEKGK